MRLFPVKNKQSQEICTARYSIESATCRRYACVGERSVLAATGVYPVLTVSSVDADGEVLAVLREDAERFNRCYRRAVEAFLDWCMEVAADEARRAYAAMGSRAPYCFRRHELLCNITTEESAVSLDLARLGSTSLLRARGGTGESLHVNVSVMSGVSKSIDIQRIFERYDTWRLPHVTMERPARRACRIGRQGVSGEIGADGSAV